MEPDDDTKDDIEAREGRIPPITRKWKILYETPQEEFLQRAQAILDAPDQELRR